MQKNRLALEKSPYLLQHQENPVDWFPWGEEAFAKAKAEDKPIFLSIGYSTCHWCHVMERESFENDAIAELLNRDFVSIKVDREERPDIDRIYMMFVQATTGSGGWPMSVFLTPEREPFFGGTYFPPTNRHGRPGFPLILERLAQSWRTERGRIVESSGNILAQLRRITSVEATPSLLDDRAAAEKLYSYFRRSFDTERGGFGSAPKFPRPSTLNFLLRHHSLTQNEESLEMVLKTLAEMALGGMNDQLGGGFHRYSVDAYWFVPHFEKMLYDQAQLAISYLEAHQITQNAALLSVAKATLDYVLRDLRHPEGGFYSAEDADSALDAANPKEKAEGAFYVWTWEELEALVGAERMPWFAKRFGVERDGNVQEDPHGEFTGKNILSISNPDTEPLDEELRARLLAARGQKPRPHLDDKVLTSWNGLMISAFAKAYQVTREEQYREAAEAALAFVQKYLITGEGQLLRRFRAGEAAVAGFLDDYACLTQALLDTYEATGRSAYLAEADRLAALMQTQFEDRESGGFFATNTQDPSVLLRIKDDYDGAEPSGNSIAADVLHRLGILTGKAEYAEAAQRTLRAFAGRLMEQGPTMPQMACSMMRLREAPRQIVWAGDLPEGLFAAAATRFLPFHTQIHLRDEAQRAAFRWSPALGAMTQGVYVCENFTCQLPAENEEQLLPLLK
ncbi:MAG: thioredoxin domain-containing protein [Bryobacter sp.]|nr:thioredoxin domain-containing protein [Bryobacter sp.]